MNETRRNVARIVALIVFLVLVPILLARFWDGPFGIIPGGPFSSGAIVEGSEPDWSFVRDIDEVELQLLEPPRSRTTWIVEHEGSAYIACGYMGTALGRIWKRWPHDAVEDGRALLRIGDRIYPRRLVRIEEGPVVPAILARLNDKYVHADAPMPVEAVRRGEIWLFALAPPG
ncbi:MAG: hypothetical protein H6748_17980 [Spirochaetaceae bacterium]|nr:hypothetical protein [Myxococcales bacterium]MCB9725943.1 hypothetical protein [Spirochaetaceae bacterium]HPG28419.1 hypothetical protein [Myxococcota bacterium]